MAHLALHLVANAYLPEQQLAEELLQFCADQDLQAGLEIHTPWVLEPGRYSYLALLSAPAHQLEPAKCQLAQHPALISVAHAV